MKLISTSLIGLFFSCFGINAIAQSTITIGTGTTSNSGSEYPAPYGNFYWGAKHQFLIRASELSAQGAIAGNITSLAFNVAVPKGTPLQAFTIRLKNTSATAAPFSFDTLGLTTVFGPQTYTETAGWNTHIFPAQFNWDGSSNLLIETCFNNSSYTNNAQIYYSNTSFNSTSYLNADNSTVCSNAFASSLMKRPNMQLNMQALPPVTFTATPTSGCKPLNVAFAISGPAATNYKAYHIKDTTTTQMYNGAGSTFSYTFTETGSYQVVIEAYNAFGSIIAKSGTNITVYGTATGFIITNAPDSGCPKTPINFQYSGSDANSVSWNFGNGDTASGTFVTYSSYTSSGTYTVKAFITTNCGVDTLIRTVKIVNTIPVTNISLNHFPDSVCPNQSVNLNTSWGYSSYIWNYGDSSASDTTIQDYKNHTYSVVGNYNTSVIIFNGCGNSATAYDTVKVNNNIALPGGLSIYINNHNPCPKQSTYMNVTSGYMSYVWNYGDGSPADSSSQYYRDRAYDSSGVFIVSVIIYNQCGNSTTLYDTVNVNYNAPFGSAYLNWDPNPAVICPGQQVNFNTNCCMSAYTWNFGDGSLVDSLVYGSYKSHNYANLGTYTTTVKLYNMCLKDTTLSVTVSVVDTIGFPTGLSLTNNSPVCPSMSAYVSAPNGYQWYVFNFGDSSAIDSSGNNSRIHQYSSTGTFTATVTVYNYCGKTTTLTTTVSVVNYLPFDSTMKLIANPAAACPNDLISFSAPSGFNYTSYIWNYGDSSLTDTSTSYTKTHKYLAAGTYTASVKIKNMCGNDTTLTVSVNINTNAGFVYGTSLSASPGTTVCPNQNVTFYTSGPYPAYKWNFGDSSAVVTNSTNSITHKYSAVGTYSGSVTITNNCGFDTTLTGTINVVSTMIFNDGSWAWNNGLGTNANDACPGDKIYFDAPQGEGYKYTWNFGDSSLADTINSSYKSHTYAALGTYSASVKITNLCGNDTTLSKTITIPTYLPFPNWFSLSVGPNPSCPGQNVYFNAPSGSNYNYQWNFGDGSPLQSNNNAYNNRTYNDTSSYNVSVKITNGCGNDTTLSALLQIKNNVGFPSSTSINFSPSTACPGQKVNFYSNWGYSSYLWNFGDGITDSSSSDANTHTYSSAGSYTASVKITNYCGVDTTVSKTIVIDTSLTFQYGAFFNANLSYACPGQNISFYGSGGYASYKWHFGDGSTDTTTTNSSIKYKYTLTGTFNATLKITNFCGKDTTVNLTIYINNNTPVNVNNSISSWPNPMCPNEFMNFSTVPDYASYQWDFGDSIVASGSNDVTHKYTVLGTYTVKVKITNSCGKDTTLQTTVTINNTSEIPSGLQINGEQSACPGDKIDFSIPNGFVSYFWDFGDGDTLTSTGGNIGHIYDTTGSYTVSVKLTNGCGKSKVFVKSITISSNVPIQNFTVNMPSNSACPGDMVFFNVSGNGGGELSGTYKYNWKFGDGDSTITIGTGTSHIYADTGTYAVTATVTNACGNSMTVIKSVSVNNNVQPVLGEFGTPGGNLAGCPGDAVIFFFFGISDNVWNFGDGTTGTGTETVMTEKGPVTVVKHAYSAAGTYTVTLTLTNKCGKSVSGSVNLQVSTNVLVDGELFIEPPSGTSGYTTCKNIKFIGFGGSSYSFDFGDGSIISTTSPTITHSYSASGSYTAKVTVTNGCGQTAEYSQLINIGGTGGPTATTSSTSPTCYNGNNGTATASASGGNTPYTYAWSAGGTTSTNTGLAAGTYTVTVTDTLGCSITAGITVSQPIDLLLTVSTVNASCGASDGSATVSASNGSAPYTYLWSDSIATTAATASNLKAGSYTVIVTSATGCTKSSVANVSNANSPAITDSIQNNNCFGDSIGSIIATVTGGTSPYSYFWSNGSTTKNLSNLIAGTYTLTATDTFACNAVKSITLTQPGALSLAISSVSANCGKFDGSASVAATGGTSGYSYIWSGTSQTTATITGMPAGTYNVTVTDTKSCTSTAQVIVNNANVPTIVATTVNVSCNGGSNGSISLNVTGGTNPYAYSWSTGATIDSVSNLTAQSYFVIVTDASNCQAIRNYTITQPAALTATTSSTQKSCGVNDGTATVAASGGTTAYSYLWSASAGNQTTATATGLVAGSYSTTVTDSKGCTATVNTSVTAATAFPATITTFNASCNGGNDGKAIVTPGGGTSPYIYQWSLNTGGQTTDTASGLAAGTYNVTVTDSSGCTALKSVVVSQPSAITNVFSTMNVKCYGDSNGTASVTASGGTSPYTYQWSNSSTQSSISNLQSSSYFVTVTDSLNCVKTDSVTITQPALLAAIVTTVNPSCNGFCNGTATVLGSGGTGAYSYLWSDTASQTSATATGLCAGTYSVTVSDINNCKAVSSAVVGQPAVLSVVLTPTNSNCGNTVGTATALPTGGTSPYSYSWANGDTTATADSLNSGSYKVTVTDNKGCQKTDSVTIGTSALPQDICLVTVDSTSTKNVIVWQKSTAGNINQYKVYRNVVGNDTLVGTVAYSSLSKFVDTTMGVNPNITSYKYKVSAVDTCGNESVLSSFHKTMHLTTNMGTGGKVNLIWDNYAGFTFNFYYRILRSVDAGSFAVLDSVDNSNFTWSDITPPVGVVNYVIEIVYPGSCVATKAAENHNTTRSNKGVQMIAQPGIKSITDNPESAIQIFPNPNRGAFTITISSANVQELALMNLLGQEVWKERPASSTVAVTMPSRSGGVYYLRILTDDGVENKKIIVE